jgi:hypothetical protein
MPGQEKADYAVARACADGLDVAAHRLPEPEIISRRPPDWSEARSYANCVGGYESLSMGRSGSS